MRVSVGADPGRRGEASYPLSEDMLGLKPAAVGDAGLPPASRHHADPALPEGKAAAHRLSHHLLDACYLVPPRLALPSAFQPHITSPASAPLNPHDGRRCPRPGDRLVQACTLTGQRL